MPQVGELQVRPILPASPQQHEPATPTPAWLPVDFVGVPEQSIGPDQHPPMLAAVLALKAFVPDLQRKSLQDLLGTPDDPLRSVLHELRFAIGPTSDIGKTCHRADSGEGEPHGCLGRLTKYEQEVDPRRVCRCHWVARACSSAAQLFCTQQTHDCIGQSFKSIGSDIYLAISTYTVGAVAHPFRSVVDRLHATRA